MGSIVAEKYVFFRKSPPQRRNTVDVGAGHHEGIAGVLHVTTGDEVVVEAHGIEVIDLNTRIVYITSPGAVTVSSMPLARP